MAVQRDYYAPRRDALSGPAERATQGRVGSAADNSTMPFRLLADMVVLLHAAFVLFVILGGLAALRRPRLAWIHLPAAAWGALIEMAGWVCPLTPLENALRHMGGQTGYGEGFIEHYVVPILYPPGLTRSTQIGMGIAVVILNASVYAWVLTRRSQPAPEGDSSR